MEISKWNEISEELSLIADKQLELMAASGFFDFKGATTPLEKLLKVRRELVKKKFRVLIMGKYGSGKATFANALMGQDILPMDKLPTTEVIREIQYAETPTATLFYKEEVNKKPLDIDVNDLPKYIVFNPDNADEDEEDKPSPYSKVVIKYPLDFCKLGIELVDSPGLDDPTCHDAITLNYLPSADAIVYCMNAQQAFSSTDKMFIETLCSLGYKFIIFVLTYFDCIEQNDAITGRHEAQEIKNYYTEILKPYTDLGTNGIFFVGSLPALMGKIRKDDKLLQSSHLPEVEKKLYEILFNERGRLRLFKAIYSVKQANRDTQRYLSDQIELLAQDKSKLAKNMSAAQENLGKAKEKAVLILDNLKTGLDGIVKGVASRARSFLVTDVIPNIGEWGNAYKPQTGISMWEPKKTGKAYTEECVKFIQTKIETTVSTWCWEELVPQYIEPKLRELETELCIILEDFDKYIDAIRANFESLTINDSHKVPIGDYTTLITPIKVEFFPWNDLRASLLLSFYVAPWNYLQALLFLYVIPIIHTNEKKMKGTIIDKIIKFIKEKSQAFVEGLAMGVQTEMSKRYEALKDDIDSILNQYNQLLREANSSMTAKGNTIGSQIALKKAIQKDNTLIADELEGFAQKIEF